MRKKILVLDISETIRNVCRNLLTRAGYETLLFHVGEEALAELKAGEAELAIIATEAEGMSGHQVVTELRKEKSGRDLPVLMLIGSAELVDTGDLMNVEPDATLNKPFSPEELLHKVDRLLHRPKEADTSGAGDDLDIEQLLAEEKKSGVEGMMEDNDDRAFLGLITENDEAGESAAKPELDKLELDEEERGSGTPGSEFLSADDTPHDYAWFVKEMGAENSKLPKAGKKKAPDAAPDQDEFQVEEIGTSRLSVKPKPQPQPGIDKAADTDKIYLDSIAEALEPHEAEAPGKSPSDLGTQFTKQLAEALAREIVKRLDLRDIAGKLEEIVSELKDKEPIE